MGVVAKRLEEPGITLPPPAAPVAHLPLGAIAEVEAVFEVRA